MICPHCKAINPDHYKQCYVCKKNMTGIEELAKDILGDDFAKAMKERQVKHEQGSEAF